jgi:hypothetical protein
MTDYKSGMLESELVEKAEVIGGNLPQCHFVHHIFYMN